MGWISVKERLPKEADTDAQGCVIGWHVYNGSIIIHHSNVKEDGFITHWRPADEPPADAEEIFRAREEKTEREHPSPNGRAKKRSRPVGRGKEVVAVGNAEGRDGHGNEGSYFPAEVQG